MTEKSTEPKILLKEPMNYDTIANMVGQFAGEHGWNMKIRPYFDIILSDEQNNVVLSIYNIPKNGDFLEVSANGFLRYLAELDSFLNSH